jgi:hypothetical protein
MWVPAASATGEYAVAMTGNDPPLALAVALPRAREPLGSRCAGPVQKQALADLLGRRRSLSICARRNSCGCWLTPAANSIPPSIISEA